jgi:uncharacterized small protein (DUF1192 family)
MSKISRKTSNRAISTKPTSQYEQILSHLRKSGNITSEQAFSRYGVTRLSSVIFNLRENGAKIENQRHTKKNKFGRTVGYDKYVLVNNF